MKQSYELKAGRPLPNHRRSATGSKLNKTYAREVSTVDHIIDEAGKLFARYGYEAVSIRQIAEACHVTIGAVYYYFPSKEGLLDEATQVRFTEFYQSLASRWRTDSSRTTSSLMGFMYDEGLKDPTFFLLMQHDMHHYDEGPRLSGSRYRYSQFSALIREALGGDDRNSATDSNVLILAALIGGFCEIAHADRHFCTGNRDDFVKTRRATLVDYVQHMFG